MRRGVACNAIRQKSPHVYCKKIVMGVARNAPTKT